MAPSRRPAAARLLLYAGLLAAAAGLGPTQPRAPAGSRAREEPPAWLQPPAGAGPRTAGPTASPPESITKHAPGLKPRDTWMLFVRKNDKEVNGVSGKKRSQDKVKRLKFDLPGLPGPPKPQGPPGPTIPPEVLLREFQQLLKDAVRQRQGAQPEVCPRGPGGAPEAKEQAGAAAGGVLVLPGEPLGPQAPCVQAAFHCRLREDVALERRALRELGAYYVPDAEGAFRRGPGLNLTSGQYTAPVAGFYSLAATLHVALWEQPRRGPARPRDRLRLLICIQSQCQRHASLEAVTGLETGSNLFTISVNGILYLQLGQYTSVFLDNASGSSLTVRGGSHFSAVLLGV